MATGTGPRSAFKSGIDHQLQPERGIQPRPQPGIVVGLQHHLRRVIEPPVAEDEPDPAGLEESPLPAVQPADIRRDPDGVRPAPRPAHRRRARSETTESISVNMKFCARPSFQPSRAKAPTVSVSCCSRFSATMLLVR